jgi:hypothetical protein
VADGASWTGLRRSGDVDDSSILDPKLTVTDPWLKVFTAFSVLVGIGILVEIARRLGMGFIAARAELEAEKSKAEGRAGSQGAP